jgi:hypothetical protein
MLTDVQVKTLLYNALTGDTTLSTAIGGRVYWFKPDKKSVFPLIVYNVLDTTASYTFGALREARETVDIQLEIWIDQSQINKLSEILERVKIILTPLAFQLQPGNPEFMDETANKIVKIMRWRYQNV